MKHFIYIAFALLLSCGQKQTTEQTVEQKDEHEEATTVWLTAEQMKAAGIQTGTIELKNLATSVRATGVLSVPNNNKALITSVTGGVLKTLNIYSGSYVKKGQVIATIVNPDITGLQQELQQTLAQINLSETELARQRELVEGNAAPLKNVQRVQTELATLRSQRNALSRQLQTMGISAASVSKGNIITTVPVLAPISGTISEVTAQIGSPVDASTPIAQIVSNQHLHLDLFVYERDLPKLHVNQVIHFTLTNNPGKEYDAKIFSIGTAFASESKTIPIHAEVLGDKTGLIEGMNITALISIGQSVVPAVPDDAIVHHQGQDFIFIQTTNDTTKKGEYAFEKMPVVKGSSDVGYTEVTMVKDMKPGTPIVTKGAFFVFAKMNNMSEHHH